MMLEVLRQLGKGKHDGVFKFYVLRKVFCDVLIRFVLILSSALFLIYTVNYINVIFVWFDVSFVFSDM